jgi:hypothetical protein
MSWEKAGNSISDGSMEFPCEFIEVFDLFTRNQSSEISRQLRDETFGFTPNYQTTAPKNTMK